MCAAEMSCSPHTNIIIRQYGHLAMYTYAIEGSITGASLSKPHTTVLSGAGYYGVSYVCRSYVNFGLWGAWDQVYLHLSTSCTLCSSGQKWLLLWNISKFLCRTLQMIIISNETTVAVQSCLPSTTYTAKSRIPATSTVMLSRLAP